MNSVDDEAAAWFLRKREAPLAEADQGAFEAWLAADPTHAAAYEAQVRLWDRFDRVAEIDALADVLERRRDAGRQSRRRFLTRAVVGLFLSGGAGGLAYRHWRNEPLWRSTFTTGIGEMATRALEDGSTLVLGPDTAVGVAYSRARRSVRLDRGTVIFDVAQDADRPFSVDGGLARVTVRGTRFAIDRLADKERVSVDHGRVEVATVWNHQPLFLDDGQVAEIDALAEGIAPPRRIDRPAADAFAFARGSIVFDGASLGEIAETLSRYRAKPVRAAAGTQAVPPLTAVAQTGNIEGFLASLAKVYPVAVSEEARQTVLSARR